MKILSCLQKMKEVLNQVNNAVYVINCLLQEDNKVRDNDRVTEKYRGSAHCSCNINLKLTKKVPVIFHNLKGYDSHLILQEIDKFNVKIRAMPNGLGKYMAFTINKNLVLIDSMQFINSSLDALVKNLSDNYFKDLSQEFSCNLLELVKQKGMYLFEYMDSFKKFFDDKVADRCEFFSSLKDECISDVSIMFKMNTMSYYHDLYLKTDLLLLVDVFERFINMCVEYYGLDPCHYLSSPGLS